MNMRGQLRLPSGRVIDLSDYTAGDLSYLWGYLGGMTHVFRFDTAGTETEVEPLPLPTPPEDSEDANGD